MRWLRMTLASDLVGCGGRLRPSRLGHGQQVCGTWSSARQVLMLATSWCPDVGRPELALNSEFRLAISPWFPGKPLGLRASACAATELPVEFMEVMSP